MKQHQLPLVAYSPLAQGDSLSGKLTDNSLLKGIAANHHATVSQIMLAWVLRIEMSLLFQRAAVQNMLKKMLQLVILN